METICFKITNVDRIGLVQDVSKVLTAYHINILSMEVQLNSLYVEIEQLSKDKTTLVFDKLKGIPSIIDVQKINYMPRQQLTQELRAILSSISDGIIAIDSNQRITQYNPVAEEIVRLPYNTVIGHQFAEIFPSDLPLLETLKQGTTYDNREIILKQTSSHYLTSGRPIVDTEGNINGAVALLKDIGEVRKLVASFTSSKPHVFHDIVYQSNAIQQVVDTINTIAAGTSTVFIQGETGTGKELVARAIHMSSSRAQEKFVPINCAAIPESLLESELFGYAKGAFTGADKNGKPGLFEFTDGGTLFLDEISEMPMALQAKLLRVLQERTVRRIGSLEERPIDVRIIAATNQNIKKMIDTGKFREDLYYRLNVIPLYVPPLRERRADISLLTQNFLQHFSIRLQKSVCTISETAMSKLMQYDWPGNVRELENVMERAVNLVTGTIILQEHIVFDSDFKRDTSQLFAQRAHSTMSEAISHLEYDILVHAMKHYHSSRSLGHALGMSHTAIIKKMHKYNLKFSKK